MASKGTAGRQRRLIRTVVLGCIGVVAAIAWLARELGMDTRLLTDFAITSALLVFGAVLAALLGAALLRGLRWLRRRG